MKKVICALSALVLAAGLFAGCGKTGESTSEAEQSSSQSQSGEEHELVVYSALPDRITQAAADGYEAYTGVPVRVISDNAGKLIEKIATGSGPQADILFGAGAEVIVQFSDLFTPYIPVEADMLDERFTDAQGLYTGLTPMPIVIMYNKNLTTKAPAGWSTLASSAYAGGVAFANPENSGTSYTALCAMALSAGKDGQANYDFVEQFAANLDGEMMEGISDVYTSVANGQFAAGITLESSVQKYLEAGYDDVVGVVYPEEGAPVALEATAIVKGTGSLADAQSFIDYVSSAEFQTKLMEDFGLRTVRTDTTDPRFYTARQEISFSACTPAQAVAMREELMPRFTAAEAKGGGESSSSAA